MSAPTPGPGVSPDLIVDQVVDVGNGLTRIRTTDQLGVIRWIQLPSRLGSIETVRMSATALAALITRGVVG